MDVFMILTGLRAGSSISELGRGFWFVVSTIAMIVLLYLVYTHLFAEAASRGEAVQSTFRTLALALLTIVLRIPFIPSCVCWVSSF